ncbi:MAG: histidinol-phosphatase [Eubacterium sp.]|nr:histidinol-phosphatase [Eubacterium sp.]
MGKFNLHTHTYRCNHARGEDEDFVLAAIENGYTTMGFSDHAPYIFPDGFKYSDFRMKPYRTQDYTDSVRELQEKYKDKIDIKLGFEVEWYPDLIEKELEYLKSFNYDYLILGQHFIGNEIEKWAQYAGHKTGKVKYLDMFIKQVLAAARSGEITYIAHPDIYRFTGSGKIYAEKMDYFLKELKEIDIPIEYNFLGYKENRHYPNPAFWELAAKHQNRTVIGLDAHQPWVYGETEKLKEMKDEILSKGLNLIDDVNEILK